MLLKYKRENDGVETELANISFNSIKFAILLIKLEWGQKIREENKIIRKNKVPKQELNSRLYISNH